MLGVSAVPCTGHLWVSDGCGNPHAWHRIKCCGGIGDPARVRVHPPMQQARSGTSVRAGGTRPQRVVG